MSMKGRLSRITLFVCLLVFACVSGLAEQAKPSSNPAPKEKKTTKTKSAEIQTELIDLNTATLDQLIRIPGIGDVWAQKIIDNRPYKVKTELKTRKIIPTGTYNKIVKQVTVN